MARQKNALRSLVEFKIYISLKPISDTSIILSSLVEFKIYISLKLTLILYCIDVV